MAKIEMRGIAAEVPDSPHFKANGNQLLFRVTLDADSTWNPLPDCMWELQGVAADVARCFFTEKCIEAVVPEEHAMWELRIDAWAEIARLARAAK